MHLYLSTADTSGEQHSANLIREFRRLYPQVKFTAMGTQILRDSGAEIVVDASKIKVMGFVAIIKHLPAIWRAFRQTLKHLTATKPNAVILVDYPGYHLILARAIKKRFPKMPIIYYITPQVWAWHQSRVKTIRKYVDHCLCILPFEPTFFHRHQISAEYVGNPVADVTRNSDRKRIKQMLGLSDHTRLISIFPGSRRKEMQYILPPLIDAARILYEQFDDLAFALAVAPGYSLSDLQKYSVIPSWVNVIESNNLNILAGSYLCLAKSGTTTLEATLLDCPLLMAYRGDWLSAQIAYFLCYCNPQMKYFSLPNIIANRAVIPEFLQESCNGAEIARVARLLLRDEDLYEQMRRDLSTVKELIGEENSATKTANALMKYLT